MRTPLVVVAGLLAASATTVLAHDLFLKLESYFIPPSTAVKVAVRNGSFSSSEGPSRRSLTRREIALRAAQFNDYLQEDGIPDFLAGRRRPVNWPKTRASATGNM